MEGRGATQEVYIGYSEYLKYNTRSTLWTAYDLGGKFQLYVGGVIGQIIRRKKNVSVSLLAQKRLHLRYMLLLERKKVTGCIYRMVNAKKDLTKVARICY